MAAAGQVPPGSEALLYWRVGDLATAFASVLTDQLGSSGAVASDELLERSVYLLPDDHVDQLGGMGAAGVALLQSVGASLLVAPTAPGGPGGVAGGGEEGREG